MKNNLIISAIVLSMGAGFMLPSGYAMEHPPVAEKARHYKGLIQFFEGKGSFHELGNAFRSPFGDWPSADHHFQSMKFTSNPGIQEKIRTAPSCRDVSAIVLMHYDQIDPYWLGSREYVMPETLRFKFQTHPELAALLLATDELGFIYYGNGGDSQEEAMFVDKLVTLREEFLSGQFYPSIIPEPVQITEETRAKLAGIGRMGHFKHYLDQILLLAPGAALAGYNRPPVDAPEYKAGEDEEKSPKRKEADLPKNNPYTNHIMEWLKGPYGLGQIIDTSKLSLGYIAWFGTSHKGFDRDNRDNNGYAWLSNYHESGKHNLNSSSHPNYKIEVRIDGIPYTANNIETLYHMYKFFSGKHAVDYNKFSRHDPSAAQAAARGIRVFEFGKANDVVLHLLRQKFLNNNLMAKALLDTGGKLLFEGNQWEDVRFGMALKGNTLTGENKLGKMLMRVRQTLSDKMGSDPKFQHFVMAPGEMNQEWERPRDFNTF